MTCNYKIPKKLYDLDAIEIANSYKTEKSLRQYKYYAKHHKDYALMGKLEHARQLVIARSEGELV